MITPQMASNYVIYYVSSVIMNLCTFMPIYLYMVDVDGVLIVMCPCMLLLTT